MSGALFLVWLRKGLEQAFVGMQPYDGCHRALVVLPWQAFGAWDKAKKRLVALLALAALVVMVWHMITVLEHTSHPSTLLQYVTALTMLFTGQRARCDWCYDFNCINYVDGMCDEDAQAFV